MTRRHRTSWAAGLVLALACASHAGAQSASPPQATPALSEAQVCEVERVALKAEVVELRARVAQLQTLLDRQVVEAERRRVEGLLPAAPGFRWDWPSLRLVPAEPAPPLQTEPR